MQAKRRPPGGDFPRRSVCLFLSAEEVSAIMADVTQLLNTIEQGDSHAAERLLPLVHDERDSHEHHPVGVQTTLLTKRTTLLT
jgi:hypothetical protein